MSRPIGCSHLVRVGVSWKTTESRRASGLIAEEFHARTSPLLALPLLFVSDLAAKKRASAQKLRQEPVALLVPDANLPTGGKKDKQKGAAKAGRL
jgi:hypothetical protein